jgi:hypothetical protein
MQSIEDMHKCFRACFLLCLALPDIGSDERQHGGEIVCNNKLRKLTANAFRWAYTHVCNCFVNSYQFIPKLFNFANDCGG